MTAKEYRNRLEKENERHEAAVGKLALEYAESNNEVKAGDVVTDGYNTIRVDGWKLSASKGGLPYLVYYGRECMSDGSPIENADRGYVTQKEMA